MAQIYQVHPNLISLWKKEFLTHAGKLFEKNKHESDQIEKLKKENDDLIHEIGKLTVDITWLKKSSMIALSISKEMIDRDEGAMSVCNQCELLGPARSTLYDTPSKASDKDLKMMEELDRLYMEDPTRGTGRMTKELKQKGHKVGH